MKNDEIGRAKNEAFFEALNATTVGIIGKDLTGFLGGQIGTGTLVKVAGRKFILTAEHVVRNCTCQELRFFLPVPHGGASREGPPESIPLEEINVRQGLRFLNQTPISDQDIDIALLELPPDFEAPNIRFQDLPQGSSLAGGATSYVMLGLPGANARELFGGHIAFRRYSEIRPFTTTPSFSDFEPNRHLVLSYPDGEHTNPRGFSGCGIWRALNDDGRPVWTVEPKLLGMVIGYWEQSRALQVLNLQTIMDYLSRV